MTDIATISARARSFAVPIRCEGAAGSTHGSIAGASAKVPVRTFKFLLKEARKCSQKGMHARGSGDLKSISPALINTKLMLLLLIRVFVQCSASSASWVFNGSNRIVCASSAEAVSTETSLRVGHL